MRYNVGMGYSVSTNYDSNTLYWSAYSNGGTAPVYHNGLEFESIELNYDNRTRNVFVKATAYYVGPRVKLILPTFAISDVFLEDLGFNVRNIANPQNSTIADFVGAIAKAGMWQQAVRRLYGSLPDNNADQMKKELEEKDRRIQELEEIIQDLKEDLEMARTLAAEI